MITLRNKPRSLYDCRHAIGADGVTIKYIRCAKGHKLGHIRNEDIYKNKPLVCRICQECPDISPYETAYEREE